MAGRNVSGSVLAPVLTAMLLAAFGSAARADAGEATVSTVGVGTVEKQPELLRMNTELQVEAPTLKAALEKLKTRRAEIKAGLVKLGAVETSIDLGEASVADANGGDQRQMMQRMMMQRMANKKAAPGADAAKTVTVSATIKADWPLKATGEELLVAATELQDSIKAAKLFDAPKSPAKAEEEEEGQSDSSSEQGPKPGEPSFIYVAKISAEEESKATAEAFAKSKEAAAKLAKAAGKSVSDLRTLTSQANDAGGFSDEYGYGRYNAYMQRYMQQAARQSAPDAAGTTEAMSPQPTKITHQVFVSTTYALK